MAEVREATAVARQQARLYLADADDHLIGAVGGTVEDFAEGILSSSRSLCVEENDEGSCGMTKEITRDGVGPCVVAYTCDLTTCSSLKNCQEAADGAAQDIEEARIAAGKILFPRTLPDVVVDVRRTRA